MSSLICLTLSYSTHTPFYQAMKKPKITFLLMSLLWSAVLYTVFMLLVGKGVGARPVGADTVRITREANDRPAAIDPGMIPAKVQSQI
jgi:hypothetical protein